jgi:hypothetical protein
MKVSKTLFLLSLVLCSAQSASAGPLRVVSLGNGSAAADGLLLTRAAMETSSLPPNQQAVWLAIEEAAAARGLTLPENLRAENIQWVSPTNAITGSPRFAVISVSVDKLLGQVRFRLRLANHPNAPLFYAWCPLRDAHKFVESGTGETHTPKSSSARVSEVAALVSIRRPAILHLHSENSSAMLRVRALQSGELGEVVRVRVLGTGATLVGRVAGTDFVDATF